MIIHNAPQGSEAWELVRKGKATASEFSRILTPAKLQFASGAKTYAAQKVAEILGVKPSPPPPSYWMDWGTEHEPDARNEFRALSGLKVEEVGFIQPSAASRFGASVDGLVEDFAILEIKCPSPENLILWHDSGVVPNEYMLQIQGGLMVTRRKTAFFCGYHPNLNPLIIEVDRDDEMIEKIEAGLQKFTELVDEMLKKVKFRERVMTTYNAQEVDL
jgi:predicted phage-related endonuclease